MRFYKYIINEAIATEDIHEIMFAMSFASIISSQETAFKKANTLNDYKDFINKCGKVLGKSKATLKTLKDYADENGSLDGYDDLKKDATKASKIAFEKIKKSYEVSKNNFISVERVFATGKKEVEDCNIILTMKKDTDVIHTSLKYGTGQFNSLSIKEVLKELYGIELGGNGILQTLYDETKYGKITINRALKRYLEITVKEEDKIPKISNMTYERFQKLPYDYRIELGKRYKNLSVNDRKDYLDAKVKMNKAIERFLEEYKTDKDDYIDLVSYIIRAKQDDSYLYVSSGGNKIYFVPSVDALSNYKIEIDVTGKVLSDFKKDLIMKIDNKPIIKADLNFRWSDKQWIGDLTQKGKNFWIDKKFEF